MPIYEYECCDCNSEFELFATLSDRDRVKCPKCQSKRIRRLISNLGYLKHPDQASKVAPVKKTS